ncbi:hypothetical protein [Lysobacter sp. F6437]|uniref:hypothetical protein n=1 Tax=Lysobacter sp. F6437 TaxID=3459296 RepID=UPI00403D8F3D
MSKFHPPASPEDKVDTDRGELRNPGDRANQPGQGGNVTPPLQQQRGDRNLTREEIDREQPRDD